MKLQKLKKDKIQDATAPQQQYSVLLGGNQNAKKEKCHKSVNFNKIVK